MKIKGLCEINDHTNATESDTEVIYPPHKKIRASRNYENNNSLANSNKNLSSREESTAKSSTNAADKDAQQSIASHEENKHKSKSPIKESKNSSSTQQVKNMASLEMGMVSCCATCQSHKLTFEYQTLELPEWQCRNGRSTRLHGLCTRTTRTDSNARHHNRNELQSKSRYKRFIT